MPEMHTHSSQMHGMDAAADHHPMLTHVCIVCIVCIQCGSRYSLPLDLAGHSGLQSPHAQADTALSPGRFRQSPLAACRLLPLAIAALPRVPRAETRSWWSFRAEGYPGLSGLGPWFGRLECASSESTFRRRPREHVCCLRIAELKNKSKLTWQDGKLSCLLFVDMPVACT